VRRSLFGYQTRVKDPGEKEVRCPANYPNIAVSSEMYIASSAKVNVPSSITSRAACRNAVSAALLNPDPMGPNWLGPKGFRDMSIGSDGPYLGGAGCRGCPGIAFILGYQVLDDLG